MIPLLGTLALASGLAASATGAVAWLRRPSGRGPALAAAGVLCSAVAAFLLLEWALITRDFAVAFVAEHGGRDVPLYYTVTGLWSAMEGSLLLWLVMLCGHAFAASRRLPATQDRPVTMVVIMVVCGCFFALTLFAANPFEAVPPPADGPGPDPLLRSHPFMGLHPPLLYLGYTGFCVPFAHGLAALVTGRAGREAAEVMRRWTLAAWVPLTAGVVLGAWWSYGVLGWGGYWEWDPVENASIIPWFTATALLHALMVRRRRGSLRAWTVALAVATFLLVLTGTFLTRSGVVASVHSFTRSSVGPVLLGVLVAVLVAACGLLVWGWDRLADGPHRRADRLPPLSRETFLLAAGALLVALAFTVLLGTLFPLLVQAVGGERVSVGPPYYDRMTVPLALALLTAMAVAPLTGWRGPGARALACRLAGPAALAAAVVAALGFLADEPPVPLVSSGTAAFALAAVAVRLAGSVRHRGAAALLRAGGRRRLGGLLAHAGVALAAVAVTASAAHATTLQTRLRVGQTAQAAGYTVRLDGVDRERAGDEMSVAARVTVLRDGRAIDVLRPSLVFYPSAGGSAVARPAVRTRLLTDLYLAVSEVDQEADEVVLRLAVNPLMALLWGAGTTVALGGLIALTGGPARREPSGWRGTARARIEEPVG
uniref:heme lyase CcmF/NrfE family subunit n=1 Tax=Nonomuraea pusilla TaxID=46177 RepID=UPI0006E13FC8|nr:cytochrome c-type biogenesis CcmF C-terminal domain-containing protein [Nonomuraea pusilla]